MFESNMKLLQVLHNTTKGSSRKKVTGATNHKAWCLSGVRLGTRTRAPLNQDTKSRPEEQNTGPSLVAQWLRVCQPMQRTRVRALVWEDPTCPGAAETVYHGCWVCTLEPVRNNCWSPCTWSLCFAMGEATAVWGAHTAGRSGPCSPQLERTHVQQWRPNAAKKIKLIKKKKELPLSVLPFARRWQAASAGRVQVLCRQNNL